MNSTHHLIFHVLDLEQGTEEWLNWRHSGIGASDASTVMGDNRFQSPSELLYQKKNKINTEPNEKMRLGTSLEPEARDSYIEETGMPVEPLCLQSKEYSWLIASMDGVTDDYGHICSGQVLLATVLWSFQWIFSASFGARPSLWVCGLN